MSILEVNNLGISFGGLKAVDDFSVTIEKNDLYGLIGPNGAGKTTVFNLLTGVYKPDKGFIKLDGKNITGSVLDNVKAGLHNHHEYTTLEGILRLPRFRAMEKEMDKKALELLDVFGLVNHANVTASNLPYGMQRKLEIARAMATGPKLLLLDEPAAGMNPNETAELMETIRLVRDRFDMTILLIEHDMKLVAGICEKLTVLNFGRILCQGETSEVLHDPEVVKAYLGD